MDMVETGSESDYPLSPATCESDFENEDELAMSQFVYYAEPGSEVPTPHIANRSISNVKRYSIGALFSYGVTN